MLQTHIPSSPEGSVHAAGSGRGPVARDCSKMAGMDNLHDLWQRAWDSVEGDDAFAGLRRASLRAAASKFGIEPPADEPGPGADRPQRVQKGRPAARG